MDSAQQENKNLRRAMTVIAVIVLFMASIAVTIRTSRGVRAAEPMAAHAIMICNATQCSQPMLYDVEKSISDCVTQMEAARDRILPELRKQLGAGRYVLRQACLNTENFEPYVETATPFEVTTASK